MQPFNAIASEGFAGWLGEQGSAIALTTGNRLMLVGLDGRGELRIDELAIDGATGMAAVGSQTIWVAGHWQLHRLEQALAAGETDDAGHDHMFYEQVAHTTGFVGGRDLAIAADGTPRFTSTLFNCVAMPSERHHFTAVWRPPFVSAYIGEDRAHLTGLALDDDGELAYVTCAAPSDVHDGWRSALGDGGVVVDARAGEIVARGLSLPHSPRVHGDELYVTAAGSGELCIVDRRDGAIETIARVPGLARGLALHGRFALLGCSRVDPDEPYVVTPVGALAEEEQRHELAIVDLDRGAVAHTLELDAASGQMYAVTVLPASAYAGASDAAAGLREELSIGPVRRLLWMRG
jgi:uncharacterized protein (TIGR03032 family)